MNYVSPRGTADYALTLARFSMAPKEDYIAEIYAIEQANNAYMIEASLNCCFCGLRHP